jgi:putative tricarboxylic transport membrane protein
MADETQGGPARSERHGAILRAPQNFAAGLSLIAVAAFALWASGGLPQGTLRSMGPGMLPRAIAVLIALCGAILVALSFLRDGDHLDRWHVRGPFFVCLSVVAFALTVRSVGLALAGPLVALISGAASPETNLKELTIFAAVITAFCIGLFKYALNLPIPVLIIPGLVYI